VTEQTGVPAIRRQRQGSWLIGLTSFTFILLQSACTAVMALSGLRLLIGLGSLAAASVIPGFIFSIHTDKIRIPMMVIAVFGSVLNLYVVWRIRSLRARPASQWRVQPVTAKERRSETIQIVLSILTLLLVVAEILAHRNLIGSFL
jgi:cytochrome b subunit of formate dehydrogenase